MKKAKPNALFDGLGLDLDWDFDWTDWSLEPSKPTLVTIRVTTDQKVIIDQALEKCRKYTEFPGMMEGRALELICADYLQGP